MNRFNIAWILSVVILISLGGYLCLYQPTPIRLKMDLSELPHQIGDWKWVRTEQGKDFTRVEGANTELVSFYRNNSGREIRLYIAYFESQGQDKKVIHYRSRWLHKKTQVVEIPVNPHGTIRINKTTFKDRLNDQLLLFWYDLNGKIISSRYQAKISTVLSGLFRSQTNGAMIIVSKNLEHSDDPKDVLQDEMEFVRELLPILRNYLPST